MKTCKKCHIDKELDEFVKYKGRTRGYCKECHVNLYAKKYPVVDISDMIQFEKCYLISKEGVIYKLFKKRNIIYWQI